MEYDLLSQIQTNIITWSADVRNNDYTHTHFHIKYAYNRLFLIDGQWAPKLVIYNILINSIENPVTEVTSLGDIVIINENLDFYSSYQYGWSVGLAGSFITNSIP